MESWKADEKTSSRVVKSAARRCNSQKVRRTKIHAREMLEKSRNAVFFQWFVCQVSRKVGLLKRRVRSHAVREESKNCTPLWRKAHSEVKMYKTWRVRSTFVSSDVKKMHAAVVKSTFGSENAQNMTCLDHFGAFWCWKIVRACGEKHICKWKCTKHDVFGPLWYVLMLKNCTWLWRKAHLQVKMHKTWGVWTTLVRSDVEKLPGAVAKRTFASQNVQNMRCLDHFCLFRCRKIARRCGERHIWKWKCSKTVVFGALLDVLMFHNSTPLWRKAVAKSTFGSESRSNFCTSDVEKLVR